VDICSTKRQQSVFIGIDIGHFCIPFMPASSCLSFPKPDIIGLSCMLLPFWPRKPQRLVTAS
jgi:hypothetical protein